KADHVTPSFDEFLYINRLPRAISYPKNRIKCLVVGEASDESLEMIRKEGYNIRHITKIEDKYIEVAGLLLCDEVNLPTEEQLERAYKLKAIGCFGKIADKNLKTLACKKGIIMFDDPKSNPRSANFIPRR